MPASTPPVPSTPRVYRLAPIATSTPIASGTRRVIRPRPGTPAATPRGVLLDPKEECCICVAAIDEKRSATLVPCRHTFHASCCTVWLETRNGRTAQTCPLCRSRVFAVEANGTSAPPVFPYGETGEPTREILQREEQPENMQWLVEQCDERILACAQMEVEARRASRPEDYIVDIQNEARGLLARKAVLRGLIDQVQRGEWHSLMYVNMERLQRLQQQLQQLRLPPPQLLRLRLNVQQQRPAADRLQQLPVQQQQQAPQRAVAQQLQQPRQFLRATTSSLQRQSVVPQPQRAPRPPQQPQLLPRGTAAAMQNRPATVPRPFNAGRATAASLSRAAARAAAPPPAAAAAAPPTPRRPVRPVPLRPQQQPLATGRVPAATAGPARRRLAATSGSPAATGSSPMRRRVVFQQADAPRQEMGALSPPLAPPVNYHETPRRSRRIASRRPVESVVI